MPLTALPYWEATAHAMRNGRARGTAVPPNAQPDTSSASETSNRKPRRGQRGQRKGTHQPSPQRRREHAKGEHSAAHAAGRGARRRHARAAARISRGHGKLGKRGIKRGRAGGAHGGGSTPPPSAGTRKRPTSATPGSGSRAVAGERWSPDTAQGGACGSAPTTNTAQVFYIIEKMILKRGHALFFDYFFCEIM